MLLDGNVGGSLKITISCLCLWVQLENLSGPAKVLTVSNVEVAGLPLQDDHSVLSLFTCCQLNCYSVCNFDSGRAYYLSMHRKFRLLLTLHAMSQSIPTGYIPPGNPRENFFELANPDHPGKFFCLIPCLGAKK